MAEQVTGTEKRAAMTNAVVLVCRSPNTDEPLVAGGSRDEVMESFAALVRSGHFTPHSGRRAAVVSAGEWAKRQQAVAR